MSDPAETTEKLKRARGACYLFNNQNRRAHGAASLLTSCQSCQNHAGSLIRDIKATILACRPADFTELSRGRDREKQTSRESPVSSVFRIFRKKKGYVYFSSFIGNNVSEFTYITRVYAPKETNFHDENHERLE